jgi:hypothetical protein
MSTMMASLGGVASGPSGTQPAPTVLPPPAIARFSATTPSRRTACDSVADSVARTPVRPTPARAGRRKTAPPPARYDDNQQTLTQMDWNPPGDESDDDLPPGVTSVTDASGKKVYRLTVGPNVFWFLSKAELEGKQPALADPTNEPRREDDMSDNSIASKNLLEDGDDDDYGNTNDRGRTLEVIANTQATVANSTTTASTGGSRDIAMTQAMTQVTPEQEHHWTPPARNEAYSQLSQLTQTEDQFYEDERNQREH